MTESAFEKLTWFLEISFILKCGLQNWIFLEMNLLGWKQILGTYLFTEQLFLLKSLFLLIFNLKGFPWWLTEYYVSSYHSIFVYIRETFKINSSTSCINNTLKYTDKRNLCSWKVKINLISSYDQRLRTIFGWL